MNCEMCGKETELQKAIIEGVEMNVCAQCGKFGRVVRRLRVEETAGKQAKKEAEEEEPEVVESIVGDYTGIIKKAREKTGLKQEDVAKKINEKESVIHQIESGHFKPGLALARKLEKFFHIILVEKVTVEKGKKKSNEDDEGMTIGDMIKIK